MILVALAVARALGLLPAIFRRSRRHETVPVDGSEALEEAPLPDEQAEIDAAIEAELAEAELAEAELDEPEAVESEPVEPEPVESEPVESEAFGEDAPRLARRLSRTRALLAAPFAAVRAHRGVDESTFDSLEEALLLADVGLTTTTRLLDALRERQRARSFRGGPEQLLEALREEIGLLFAGDETRLRVSGAPAIWLFVGVNGVGKTTTIGKLAARERRAGHEVVLAAGDTFRAAAAEQLESWAERSGTGFVRGSEGADPSSVVFDAVQHAAARGADLVLADTAGRLHTRVNLMEELRKIRRVAERPPGTVAEVLLVLDATTGQNGLAQAREFLGAVEVTGIVLTKLDGTAKGGVVLPIRAELGVPIKLVGLGEGIDDLVEFDPAEFAAALIG